MPPFFLNHEFLLDEYPFLDDSPACQHFTWQILFSRTNEVFKLKINCLPGRQWHYVSNILSIIAKIKNNWYISAESNKKSSWRLNFTFFDLMCVTKFQQNDGILSGAEFRELKVAKSDSVHRKTLKSIPNMRGLRCLVLEIFPLSYSDHV